MKKLVLLLNILIISMISKAEAPKWLYNTKYKGYNCAVGGSPIKSGQKFMARQIASTVARAELAKKIKIHVQVEDNLKMTTKDGTDFSSISKQVSNELIKGSEVLDVWTSEENELYVLIGIPKLQIKEMEESIEEKYKTKVEIAFEELEESLK